MQQAKLWILTGILATAGLTACQNGVDRYQAKDSTISMLSDVQPEEPLSAPDITLAMERFFSNIGDTASGAGYPPSDP